MQSDPVSGEESPYLEAILGVATELFSKKGYLGTSMRDLGEGLGIHAGSLYLHIKGKEDLLFSIVDRISRTAEASMREVLGSGEPALSQLRRVAVNQLELVSQNREAATVYFHEWRNLSEPRRREVIKSRDRWEAGLRSIITECIADGEFRAVNVDLAGIALISMLNWSYQWFSPDGRLEGHEIAELFTDYLVTGLRSNKPSLSDLRGTRPS